MNSTPYNMGNRRRVALLLASLLAALVTTTVFGYSQGRTTQGWAVVEGGVGRTEIERMDAEKGKYSLWIITAARVSGAYLADVDVSITDEKGAKVFERKIQGPWLFIDLPLGRYEVRGRVGQETTKGITTIHPGDHHQMVLYFDVQGEVQPKQ